jgi:hypothetical protein
MLPLMTETKTVRIECEGVKVADINDFSALQGDLKTLSDDAYSGLKAEIIEEGFSFSLHVWEHEGKRWIEDGHQRITALKRMREEGWEIPPIPYSLVYADDVQQAKRKILGAASQYGKVSETGLKDFLKDIHLDPIRLENFRLPEIKMPQFIETHLRFDERIQGIPTSGKPEDQWQGMPEFNQGDRTSFRHVVVHFRNEQDAAEFFKAIGQTDTGNTRSLWFPPQENMDTESKRYSDDDGSEN